jgi:DNA-binding PadR family transcriptional regulator
MANRQAREVAPVSVRHAMLALLSEGPKYGLQLREEFEARTGEVWPLNVGQVYTTLQRLERDGLVASEGDGEGPQKSYKIMPGGADELSAWLRTPPDLSSPPRDELDPADLNLALAVDAELFRLDSVVRWLDVADARIKRASSDEESPFANRANEGTSRPDGAIPAAEANEQWPLPRPRTHLRTRR